MKNKVNKLSLNLRGLNQETINQIRKLKKEKKIKNISMFTEEAIKEKLNPIKDLVIDNSDDYSILKGEIEALKNKERKIKKVKIITKNRVSDYWDIFSDNYFNETWWVIIFSALMMAGFFKFFSSFEFEIRALFFGLFAAVIHLFGALFVAGRYRTYRETSESDEVEIQSMEDN